MSKLSPSATKALSELEALAKSKAVERAAQPNPKLPPADRIAALTKSFVTTPRRAPATKPTEGAAAPSRTAPPVSKSKPEPAFTPRALDGSGTSAEKLQAISNAQAGSAPCTLSREQLGPGPSEQMLRFARAARDRLEEAERQKAQEQADERLCALRGWSPPWAKQKPRGQMIFDPITQKLVARPRKDGT
jgi:hypothetical protein